MLQVGIVGLANVGKSTMFNALLKKQAAMVANYPFATIEPNVGIVPVPDERLNKLATYFDNPPIVPATVKFVDIAGLVKGASTGAGLGNKFLANIREVDLICLVVRDFEDPDIIREESSLDPESDIATVETELALADFQTLDKVAEQKMTPEKKEVLNLLRADLNASKKYLDTILNEEERQLAKELQLIAAKPVLYVHNVKYGSKIQSDRLEIDAKVESELADFPEVEQKEYLKTYNLSEPGLNRLIKRAYEMLGLISFLTAGDKEVRAWTIKKGTKAPAAAGVIHTDFEKNFIKAEVISYQDYLEYRGYKGSRDAGKVRLEGREYEVNDGDVIEFKVGV